MALGYSSVGFMQPSSNKIYKIEFNQDDIFYMMTKVIWNIKLCHLAKIPME